MSKDESHCNHCGAATPIHHLDAKPTHLKGPELIFFSWWRRRRLRSAADQGIDFDRLECRSCYGSGYIEAQP